MVTTPPDLSALDAMHDATSAGQWACRINTVESTAFGHARCFVQIDQGSLLTPLFTREVDPNDARMLDDARFVCTIHNAYPALSARIRELEAGLREAFEFAADLRSYTRDWDWKHGAEWDAEKARLELVLKGDAK